MPWTEQSKSRPTANPAHKLWDGRHAIAFGLAGLIVLLTVSFLFAQEKRLAVYSSQTFYDVPVIDREGRDFVGLLELLEPLGKVESRVDGRKWILTFKSNGSPIIAEFQDGRRKGKVRGAEFDLGANFSLQGERGYVPVASLTNLLPRMIEKTVDLHLHARRLFIGSVGFKSAVEVKHSPNRLVVRFPVAVSPTISSDSNHLRLTFQREPVISNGLDTVAYPAYAPIISTNFSEANGTAVLDVTGTGPLQASYSDGGKVITISAAQAAGLASTPAPAQPAAKETPLPPPNFPAETAPAAPVRARTARTWLVAIDAAHGGDERGAQLTETLNEKDVTLALARRIQHELEARGISVVLVRNSDTTMTFDQRAVAANSSRAAIYISVHAATLGTGTRVYTALLPPTSVNRRAFLPWETAQSGYLDLSSTVAGSVAAEFQSRKMPVRAMSAPIRPLNNIATAAIAIEIAPANDTVESLTESKYQQDVATAVAAGIAAVRGKVEAQP